MNAKRCMLGAVVLVVLPLGFGGCEATMDDVAGAVGSVIPAVTGSKTQELTVGEVVDGLKEALRVGTGKASSYASQPNGFYGNPQIRIPFPQDAVAVKNAALKVGLSSGVDRFEQKLNAAAEKAAGKAAPIFYEAIRSMSFSDAKGILRGGNTAATDYFRRTTSTRLEEAFRPVVVNSLEEVKVAQYWTPLVTAYNLSPVAKREVNPDLEGYVTERAVAGLFALIASEEMRIRQDPAARVTEILKKVFGSSLARG